MSENWVADPRPTGLWHIDGLSWYDAPNPKPRHTCQAQTKGNPRGEWVFRCACGAIALDAPEHWMQKNANLDPRHTIYSRDYQPPRRIRLAFWRRQSVTR